MIRSRMLVAKVELNPYEKSFWAWLELYFTPKRYHLRDCAMIIWRGRGALKLAK